MTDKNRKRTRIHGHFRGVLTHLGRDYPITTINLSLKGILCILDQAGELPLVRGDECRVTLTLSESVSLKIDGIIARIHGQEVGVDITSLDEESYTHLRNIVRFSSDDPDAIDMEQAERPFA